MKKYIPNIDISYTFPFFLVLIMVSGRYKLYFIFFLLCFIHEIGHVLMGYILKCSCSCIKILPFGVNATIVGKEKLKSYQECLIYIAGPCMYFVNGVLIEFLYSISFLSYIGFVRANESNLLILIFNLLPILPLDGGNILRCIFDKFFRLKVSKGLCLSISSFMLVLLIVATSSSPQYIIYTFLIFEQVQFFLTSNNEYIKIVINRKSKKYKKKVHSKKDLYRDVYNYYLSNDQIYNEEVLCEMLIAESIKNNN